jgi:multiple sugar transport system permease protein
MRQSLPSLFAKHTFLILVALSMIGPFYWMLATSFKAQSEILRIPPTLFPTMPTLDNYRAVFEVQNGEGQPLIVSAFGNSLMIAVSSTLGTLFTSSLAAYSFAKIRFRYKNILFFTFLALLMIPSQVTLIPLYIVFARIGWVDTLLPLIVPVVLLNPFGIFLMRQFMLGIPDAYVESAKLDGANHFRIFWSIMLPLCRPPLITLGLLTFVGRWNDFFGPLIYLSSESKFPLTLLINSFRGRYSTEWGIFMAAAVIAVLPIMVIYVLAQKSLIEGIATTSGLKG